MRLRFVVAFWLAVAPAAGLAGDVQFFRTAGSSFDRYTADPTPAAQQWMRERYWRLLVYAPYFDARLAWSPPAWFYKDLYAIYPGSAAATEHPEWILRDGAGVPLYIPWGCANGTCPQYAGDPGSPAFRARWIAEARTTLAAGYRGIFVDDVNLTVTRIGDGSGDPVVPTDPRTGAEMTEAAWRGYVAEFTEAIRAAFPQAEIAHNALWFLGHDDASIARELSSADWINLERGVNDAGIRGGAATYGFETLLAYVDWLHARGAHVVLDAAATTDAAREYGLAAYFLVRSGADGVGNDAGGRPDDWWSGYDASLGDALGPRRPWAGVLRRDFAGGMALVNEPDAAPVTLDVGGGWVGIDGRPRTTVALGPAAGVVLKRSLAPPTLVGVRAVSD